MVEANPAQQEQEENKAQEQAEEQTQETEHQQRYKWPPLESDPEIFTNYMAKMGLPPNWVFSELYGFEEDLLSFIP